MMAQTPTNAFFHQRQQIIRSWQEPNFLVSWYICSTCLSTHFFLPESLIHSISYSWVLKLVILPSYYTSHQVWGYECLRLLLSLFKPASCTLCSNHMTSKSFLAQAHICTASPSKTQEHHLYSVVALCKGVTMWTNMQASIKYLVSSIESHSLR